MKFREGNLRDIPHLVMLDQASYGEYGADENYFQQKLTTHNVKIILAETAGEMTGFVVFEVLDPGQPLVDFSDFHIHKPIEEKWMHIIAFTTKTNYKDIQSDSELLLAAERQAKNLGCSFYGISLSVLHPYIKNGVFNFWEKNGYHKSGTIKWIASPNEKIDCYFYSKK